MLVVPYSFYADTFHGKLDEAEFCRLAVQAAAYLDELTMGRVDGLDGFAAQRARLALCAVADALSVNEQGGGIASETNDGISVTYVNGSDNAKSEGRRLYEAAALFLGPTGLLYRGVR